METEVNYHEVYCHQELVQVQGLVEVPEDSTQDWQPQCAIQEELDYDA